MALNIGSRLGHYDVTALIGEGGMGQVYQATDTNLDRQVAIKALPDAFSSDPDRLARFEREAKVLASLNHPNIGAIYGLEKAGDTRALVLELVEGPTLADRIAQGPIPIDEALPIAKQIAEALEAAHEAGVIHRDLKPANIKVKDDGTVKVLDFGLAKALDTTPEGDPSQSPTLTAAATQMGVIMGTAAYMSPEQAKGRTVDKRADVWAFGAVLFEMLTGRRAFPGEDLTDTIAAVMKSEPAWDALPADTAPRLTQILHACLEKDRARRVRDLGDVQLAMEGAFESLLRPTGAAESSETAGRRRSLLYVVGGIALLVGVAIGGALRSGDDGDRPVQRFALSLPSTAKPWFDGLGGMAISPDGTRLVYVTMVEGQRVLAAQRLGQRDVYRTRFPGHTFVLCRLAQLILLARLDRRLIPKLLETPGLVVPLHEVGHGGADGLEVLKDSAVDRLLLERTIPPLRHPVRFRFLDKAEAGVDPPIPDLLEEVV